MADMGIPSLAMWLVSLFSSQAQPYTALPKDTNSSLHSSNQTYDYKVHTSYAHSNRFISSPGFFETGVMLFVVQTLCTLFVAQIRTAWYKWRYSGFHTITLAEGQNKDEVFSAVAEWALKALEEQEQQVSQTNPNVPTSAWQTFRASYFSSADPQILPAQIRSVVARAIYDKKREILEMYDPYGVRQLAKGKQSQISFTPDNGTYNVTYNIHTISIRFGTGKTPEESALSAAASDKRTLSLSCAAKGKEQPMDILKNLVSSCVEAAQTTAGPQTHIFMDNYGSGWRRTASRTPRKISSVILRSGVKENILADITNFLSAQKWYEDCGVPYRRGYLLYGPPGTGKTSLITAIAGEFNMNICIINLAGAGMSDAWLCQLLSESPADSILLLEDIDVAMSNATEDDDDSSKSNGKKPIKMGAMRGMRMDTKLTLSGLLNALDGVASQEGRITFMTTNSVASLPAAVLRPGRCDLRVHLDKCDEHQIAGLFAKFFGSSSGDDGSRLTYDEALKTGYEVAQKFPEGSLSAAQLQGYFMRFVKDWRGAGDGLKAFLVECKEEEKIAEGRREKRKVDSNVVTPSDVVTGLNPVGGLNGVMGLDGSITFGLNDIMALNRAMGLDAVNGLDMQTEEGEEGEEHEEDEDSSDDEDYPFGVFPPYG
ncbi:mitochondrial chaperone [Rhizophlyctis rosea]|uniref:Mitochondrial chaperone n=1 Tax=Rhizophlyctis rosea TaxID=64517 RepID=A0AAD5SE19_9FUNG|nr:mitochondrial chaperone [Rhizophlyctis rosea]